MKNYNQLNITKLSVQSVSIGQIYWNQQMCKSTLFFTNCTYMYFKGFCSNNPFNHRNYGCSTALNLQCPCRCTDIPLCDLRAISNYHYVWTWFTKVIADSREVTHGSRRGHTEVLRSYICLKGRYIKSIRVSKISAVKNLKVTVEKKIS